MPCFHLGKVICPYHFFIPWYLQPLLFLSERNEAQKPLQTFIKKSENHGIAWVGRDLQDHLVPTPAPWVAVHWIRLPKAPSKLSLLGCISLGWYLMVYTLSWDCKWGLESRIQNHKTANLQGMFPCSKTESLGQFFSNMPWTIFHPAGHLTSANASSTWIKEDEELYEPQSLGSRHLHACIMPLDQLLNIISGF